MTGAWPKLFALCIRGPGLMCHMLHARYSRILFLLACLPACLPACWHTYTRAHERRIRRRSIDTSSSSYVVSRLRLYVVSPTWSYKHVSVLRATLSPCACVYTCTKERQEQHRIRSRCTAPRRNFENSASACARPLSTLVNRGSSQQHRRHSLVPSSPSLQGQDLPLKPNYSSIRKKLPKETRV